MCPISVLMCLIRNFFFFTKSKPQDIAMQETFTLLSHHSDHFSLLAELLNNNQTNTENETYMLDNKLPEWATDVTGNRMCSVMQLAYNDYGQHDHSQLQLLAVTCISMWKLFCVHGRCPNSSCVCLSHFLRDPSGQFASD